MKTYKQFILERFENLFVGDEETKRKYVDQVWDILQTSYKDIGGIKGKGFGSKEEMIQKIPFWKIARQGDKVEVVVMYRDKGGRKSVAIGSTGSEWSHNKVIEIFKADMKRSYGEKSKAALGLLLKQYPENIIKPFTFTPKQVADVSGKEITPLTDVPEKDWPKDAKMTLSKFPWIREYGYFREIGGEQTFKVMIGTPGKKIV